MSHPHSFLETRPARRFQERLPGRQPAAGLVLIDEILERGQLTDYHLAHSAKADLNRRIGNKSKAREAYLRALALAKLEPERRFLEKRLAELK